MIRILAILSFLLMLSASRQTNPPIKVIFFGDSITEMGVQENGYIWRLKKMLQICGMEEKYDLIGSGIGGNKIYDLLFRLETDVLDKKPDLVVVWIGVNDVWHKSTLGTGTDADKFEKMYESLVRKMQSKGITVFCCTPACIGEKNDGSNPLDSEIDKYSNIIRKVSDDTGAFLIDIRQEFLNFNETQNKLNQSSGILTTDGVHLNELGNMQVAELIYFHIIR